jgi:hypothetical protein
MECGGVKNYLTLRGVIHGRSLPLNNFYKYFYFFSVSQLREHWEETSSKVMARRNQVRQIFNVVLIRLKVTLLLKIQWKQHQIYYVKIVYKHNMVC